MNSNAQAILAALEGRGPVRREGRGWRTRCPAPDHEDRHPSFFLYPGGGGRCFSQCNRYWPPWELAELLGIRLPSERGLTVDELAQAKGLPADFLQSLGVRDGVAGSGPSRAPCVDIPYADERGQIVAVRKRVRLEGPSRFFWRRGDRAMLYGLAHLREIRQWGVVIVVEGESDCWTLWYNRIPAVGVPGASAWRREFSGYIEGLRVFVWREPDTGGDSLLQAVSTDLPDVRIIEPPPQVKDVSELFLREPEGFKQRMRGLARAARSASELRAEALTAEARQAWQQAGDLFESPGLFELLQAELEAAGYVGDPRPAMMAYIALTSRLLEEPLNLAYISQSAAGKNAAIDAALPFLPSDAYYVIRASSPRALIYNDEQFHHRTVILTEVDSLTRRGSRRFGCALTND